MFWSQIVRFCYWHLRMGFAGWIDTRARVRIESLRSTENNCKLFLTSWQICNVVKTLTVVRYCLIRWRIIDGVIRMGFDIREWNIHIHLHIHLFKTCASIQYCISIQVSSTPTPNWAGLLVLGHPPHIPEPFSDLIRVFTCYIKELRSE